MIKKSVIVNKKDFLFDLSGVHSPYVDERVDWVDRNVLNYKFKEYRISENNINVLEVPPFAVVVSSPIEGLLERKTNKRFIKAIELCDSIDGIKETILHHLTESSKADKVRVDLFVHNGGCFEKVPYNVGCREKDIGIAGYRCTVDELDKYFDTECALKKRIYEDRSICAELEAQPDGKVFVEIPNLWEVRYTDKLTGEDGCVFFTHKNLESVLYEVACRMLLEDIENYIIENSWHTIIVEFYEDLNTIFSFFKVAKKLSILALS